MSTPIFSKSKYNPHRDLVSRLVTILQLLSNSRRGESKWVISCAIHTSYTSVNHVLKVADKYQLIEENNDVYSITMKGRKALEVLTA